MLHKCNECKHLDLVHTKNLFEEPIAHCETLGKKVKADDHAPDECFELKDELPQPDSAKTASLFEGF